MLPSNALFVARRRKSEWPVGLAMIDQPEGIYWVKVCRPGGQKNGEREGSGSAWRPAEDISLT